MNNTHFAIGVLWQIPKRKSNKKPQRALQHWLRR